MNRTLLLLLLTSPYLMAQDLNYSDRFNGLYRNISVTDGGIVKGYIRNSPVIGSDFDFTFHGTVDEQALIKLTDFTRSVKLSRRETASVVDLLLERGGVKSFRTETGSFALSVNGESIISVDTQYLYSDLIIAHPDVVEIHRARYELAIIVSSIIASQSVFKVPAK